MIRRLYVHNFRSLENFEMHFTPGQPTVLMGANGSGKSSVRLALEYARYCFVGAATGFRFDDTKEGSSFLEAEFVLNETQYVYHVEFGNADPVDTDDLGFWDGQIATERLTIDGQERFLREGLRIQSTSGSIGLSSSFTNITSLQFEATAEPVRAFWRTANLLNPVPSVISSFGVQDQMKSDASWLYWASSQLIGKSAREAVAFLSALQSLLSDLEDFSVDKQSVFFTRHKRQARVLARSLSDGEKMLFLAAYLISAAKVGQANFLLWDEPESFLAKSELQGLTRMLKHAYKDGQLILCTHDADVANVFDPEHVLWFYRDQGTGPTRYKKLSELPEGGPLSVRLALGDLDPA